MTGPIATRFQRFAEREADGSSPLYAALARGAAADPFALAFLAALPDDKQQPNLLLAALRHVAGTPSDWPQARARARSAGRRDPRRHARPPHPDQRAGTLRHAAARPGTPEAAACLARGRRVRRAVPAPRPLRLRLRRPPHRRRPRPRPRSSTARANAATPLPAALPRVAWRAGLDLSPLDLHDPVQCAWLETLVWPEHTGRLRRLRAAMRIARADPPPVHRGDLLTGLPAIARQAPGDATLVVFHTAVLAYIADPAARDRFADTVRGLTQCGSATKRPACFPPSRPACAAEDRPVLSCWRWTACRSPGHSRTGSGLIGWNRRTSRRDGREEKCSGWTARRRWSPAPRAASARRSRARCTRRARRWCCPAPGARRWTRWRRNSASAPMSAPPICATRRRRTRWSPPAEAAAGPLAHPGQQCRPHPRRAGAAHAGRGLAGGAGRRPHRAVPPGPRGAARHAAPPRRADHQHRQHRRRHRQCRPGQLCRGQGRPGRHDQGAGAGGRLARHHGERRRARLHRHRR